MEKKGSKNNCFFVIRGWHMLRWVCLSFSRKKSWRKESKMFLESKSRLFFLVKQKLPNPQSFFFYKKQQKVEKLQRNNISCQLTTFLSSQFASFFHIFIFLKRKPFTCDSYLKKNNKQFLTAGVILRFFRAHTCLYPNIVTTAKSPSTHGPSLSPSQRNDESVW